MNIPGPKQFLQPRRSPSPPAPAEASPRASEPASVEAAPPASLPASLTDGGFTLGSATPAARRRGRPARIGLSVEHRGQGARPPALPRAEVPGVEARGADFRASLDAWAQDAIAARADVGEVRSLTQALLRYNSAINPTLTLRGSFKTLPACLGGLPGLQKLSLSGCSALQALPETLTNLRELRELDLTSCSALQKLPETLGDLRSLEKLNLHGCASLVGLPESLGSLQALRSLSLDHCTGLRSLPESLGALRSLSTLRLEQCVRLQALPDSLVDLPLTELNLTGCASLRRLPVEIGLIRLEKLILRGCSALAQLPDGVTHLAHLWKLDLSGCTRLTALPEHFGRLQGLLELIVRDCHALTALPESLGELWALQRLHVADCALLEALPESLGRLSELTCLEIMRCDALRAIPASFSQLKALEQLELSYLPRAEFPPALVNWRVLAWQAPALHKVRLLDCRDLDVPMAEYKAAETGGVRDQYFYRPNRGQWVLPPFDPVSPHLVQLLPKSFFLPAEALHARLQELLCVANQKPDTAWHIAEGLRASRGAYVNGSTEGEGSDRLQQAYDEAMVHLLRLARPQEDPCSTLEAWRNLSQDQDIHSSPLSPLTAHASLLALHGDTNDWASALYSPARDPSAATRIEVQAGVMRVVERFLSDNMNSGHQAVARTLYEVRQDHAVYVPGALDRAQARSAQILAARAQGALAALERRGDARLVQDLVENLARLSAAADTGQPLEAQHAAHSELHAVINQAYYTAQLSEADASPAGGQPLPFAAAPVPAEAYLSFPIDDPALHTMGARRDVYIRTKVPTDWLLERFAAGDDCVVHAMHPAAFERPEVQARLGYTQVQKHTQGVNTKVRRYNNVRPTFFSAMAHGKPVVLVITLPTEDFTEHYASMVACLMAKVPGRDWRKQVRVVAHPEMARTFLDDTGLDARFVKPGDVVVLGRVEHLMRELPNLLEDRNRQHGQLERHVWQPLGEPVEGDHYGSTRVLVGDGTVLNFLGVKYSYWGDLAESLSERIASLGCSEVLYFAKLGSLSEDPRHTYTAPFTAERFLRFRAREPQPVYEVNDVSNPVLNASALAWRDARPGSMPFWVPFGAGAHAGVATLMEQTHAFTDRMRIAGARSVDNEIPSMARGISKYNATSGRHVRFSPVHYATDFVTAAAAVDLMENPPHLGELSKFRGLEGGECMSVIAQYLHGRASYPEVSVQLVKGAAADSPLLRAFADMDATVRAAQDGAPASKPMQGLMAGADLQQALALTRAGHCVLMDPPEASFSDLLAAGLAHGTRAPLVANPLRFTDTILMLRGAFADPRFLGARPTVTLSLPELAGEPSPQSRAQAALVLDALLYALTDRVVEVDPVSLPGSNLRGVMMELAGAGRVLRCSRGAVIRLVPAEGPQSATLLVVRGGGSQAGRILTSVDFEAPRHHKNWQLQPVPRTGAMEMARRQGAHRLAQVVAANLRAATPAALQQHCTRLTDYAIAAALVGPDLEAPLDARSLAAWDVRVASQREQVRRFEGREALTRDIVALSSARPYDEVNVRWLNARKLSAAAPPAQAPAAAWMMCPGQDGATPAAVLAALAISPLFSAAATAPAAAPAQAPLAFNPLRWSDTVLTLATTIVRGQLGPLEEIRFRVRGDGPNRAGAWELARYADLAVALLGAPIDRMTRQGSALVCWAHNTPIVFEGMEAQGPTVVMDLRGRRQQARSVDLGPATWLLQKDAPLVSDSANPSALAAASAQGYEHLEMVQQGLVTATARDFLAARMTPLQDNATVAQQLADALSDSWPGVPGVWAPPSPKGLPLPVGAAAPAAEQAPTNALAREAAVRAAGYARAEAPGPADTPLLVTVLAQQARLREKPVPAEPPMTPEALSVLLHTAYPKDSDNRGSTALGAPTFEEGVAAVEPFSLASVASWAGYAGQLAERLPRDRAILGQPVLADELMAGGLHVGLPTALPYTPLVGACDATGEWVPRRLAEAQESFCRERDELQKMPHGLMIQHLVEQHGIGPAAEREQAAIRYARGELALYELLGIRPAVLHGFHRAAAEQLARGEERARSSLQLLCCYQPLNGTYWRALGMCAQRQNDSEQAMHAYTRALALNAGDGLAWALRAESRACLGDLEGAREDREVALKVEAAERQALGRTDLAAGVAALEAQSPAGRFVLLANRLCSYNDPVLMQALTTLQKSSWGVTNAIISDTIGYLPSAIAPPPAPVANANLRQAPRDFREMLDLLVHMSADELARTFRL